MPATYRELEAHAALRSFVDRLWVSEVIPTDAPTGAPRRVLPDGCVDLVVALDGAAPPVVVGTMTRAVLIPPGGPERTVAVRFKPGGAFPFLRVPAAELADSVVEMAALDAGWIDATRVARLADIDGAARELERQLLARLSRVAPPDPVVAYAARALFSPHVPTVEALSATTGWSRQHLARMFKRHVGVGPKTLARVARLQRAVQALQRPRRDGSLAAAALDLGYFDQAHMARDFRELAGIAPSLASEARGSIFPIASLLVEP